MKYHPWHTWWYPWLDLTSLATLSPCTKQGVWNNPQFSVFIFHLPLFFPSPGNPAGTQGCAVTDPTEEYSCSYPVAFKYSRHHLLRSFSIFLRVTTSLRDVTFKQRGATLLWDSCGSSCIGSEPQLYTSPNRIIHKHYNQRVPIQGTSSLICLHLGTSMLPGATAFTLNTTTKGCRRRYSRFL